MQDMLAKMSLRAFSPPPSASLPQMTTARYGNGCLLVLSACAQEDPVPVHHIGIPFTKFSGSAHMHNVHLYVIAQDFTPAPLTALFNR
jgi:hypothetical protein